MTGKGYCWPDSIGLALEAATFFEIDEAEARLMIRHTAEHIAAGWREALSKVGLTSAQAREYEPAFARRVAPVQQVAAF